MTKIAAMLASYEFPCAPVVPWGWAHHLEFIKHEETCQYTQKVFLWAIPMFTGGKHAFINVPKDAMAALWHFTTMVRGWLTTVCFCFSGCKTFIFLIL